MGGFNTSKTIETKLRDVRGVLADAKAHFEGKGFEVKTEETVDGGFISITKGGLFKEGLGLKSALNTTLKFQGNAILAEAKVGAFGGTVHFSNFDILVNGYFYRDIRKFRQFAHGHLH